MKLKTFYLYGQAFILGAAENETKRNLVGKKQEFLPLGDYFRFMAMELISSTQT